MMKLDLRDIPVYYINMASAVDRRKQLEILVKDAEFKNCTRIEGVVKEDSREGCAASHLTIMQNNKPPFIVLEDDCIIKNYKPLINIPDDADAVYLGISSWGRLESKSGPHVMIDPVNDELIRIHNMLSTHAMLFLSDKYCSMCEQVAEFSARNSEHIDIGYAEIHKYFNVYAFNDPMFYQSSSAEATNKPLTSYKHFAKVQ